MSNIRAIAATILVKVSRQGRSLNELLPYRKCSLSGQDEALLQELCFGVCRWYVRLTYLTDQLLKKPLKGKDEDLLMLLLVGLYQLSSTRIPAHAAINETVAATKNLGKPWARGLVNALLRRFQRERAAIIEQASAIPEYQYSHPQWLLTRLQKAWPDQWPAITAANNRKGPMTLRVNDRKTDRDDYLRELQKNTIEGTSCRSAPQGIVLTKPAQIDALPGFNTGLVSVQDEAAQLAAGLLELAPDQRILDACSAPGGKCCHILEQQPAIKDLWAVELISSRIEKIKRNLERLELSAHLVTADISEPDQWWDGKPFDRILLDAPCSATGVIRRHPDIKLLRRNADIDKLAKQQLSMLFRLWPLLKSGGLLLYATCSILPEEDEQVIASFMANTSDAREEVINADWGEPGRIGRYLLPTIDGPDGFYYAKLRKA